MKVVEIPPSVQDIIDISQLKSPEFKITGKVEPISFNARILESKKEVENVINSIDKSKVVLLRKAVEPKTFQPIIHFMVIDSKEGALMHQFYQCKMELTPNALFEKPKVEKKQTLLEKLSSVWKKMRAWWS